MRLTVLGSGTLVPDDDRRSPAHLLEAPGVRMLFDCGSGTVHGLGRHGVAWQALTHLALTHFHPDHVGDVAPLLFALKWGTVPPREEPLTLLGPPGLAAWMERLSRVFGSFVLDPGFPVEVVELERHDTWRDPEGRFSLATFPTPHTDESVAYRWQGLGGTFGYTGDTGPSDGLGGFLRGVDVLVAECSLPDPLEVEGHLGPEGVAALARAARPKILLLTHIYPVLDPTGAVDGVRRAGYRGRTLAPGDGLRVEWDEVPEGLSGPSLSVIFPGDPPST